MHFGRELTVVLSVQCIKYNMPCLALLDKSWGWGEFLDSPLTFVLGLRDRPPLCSTIQLQSIGKMDA